MSAFRSITRVATYLSVAVVLSASSYAVAQKKTTTTPTVSKPAVKPATPTNTTGQGRTTGTGTTTPAQLNPFHHGSTTGTTTTGTGSATGAASANPFNRGGGTSASTTTSTTNRIGTGTTATTPVNRTATPPPYGARTTPATGATAGNGGFGGRGAGPAPATAQPRNVPGARSVGLPGGERASVVHAPGGRSEIRTQRPDGALQTIHTGPGGRSVETVREFPGGRERVVSVAGGHGGFVEHPIGGRPGFVRRSYLVDGRPRAFVLHQYAYGGHYFYRRVPGVIYRPGFYGWAVAPWGPRVTFAWGWQAQPWFGVYGGVFTPYPAYASMDMWMTDYIISRNMQAAYNAGRNDQMAADGPGAPPPPGGDAGAQAGYAPEPVISDDLKAQIDTEVRAEIQDEEARAQAAQQAGPAPAGDGQTANADDGSLPDMLKPNHILFPVNTPLTLQVNGQPCTLSANSWIKREGPMDKNGMIPVSISASRPPDCAVGAKVQVSYNELDDMEINRQQEVAEALQYAANNMGKGGIPAGPAAAPSAIAAGTTSPDMNVNAVLQKQDQDSGQTVQQVSSVSGGR